MPNNRYTMANIEIFKNDLFGSVRVTVKESQPLFCLADVCRALKLNNPSQVKTRLRQTGMQLIDLQTLSKNEGLSINELGNTHATFINEGNLYKCIFQSRSEDAEKFQEWVCDEVLPSIRKTGGYIAAKTEDTPEEIMARALLVAQDTLRRRDERIAQLQRENESQQRKIEQDAPKVTFSEAVEKSENSILIAQLARLIKQNGVDMGQNRLFKWMRSNGYLCRHGEYYNLPTQKAMDMGLFEIQVRTIVLPDGMTRNTRTPLVTGKGQVYFVNRFLKRA